MPTVAAATSRAPGVEPPPPIPQASPAPTVERATPPTTSSGGPCGAPDDPSARATPGPLTEYFASMHGLIHPGFAEGHLAAFDALPAAAPVNEPTLCTAVEMVVSRAGGVVRLEVVRPSGVDAFDEAAIRSVRDAAPFRPPPAEIAGGARIRWEFRRDAVHSCSSMFTRVVDGSP